MTTPGRVSSRRKWAFAVSPMSPAALIRLAPLPGHRRLVAVPRSPRKARSRTPLGTVEVGDTGGSNRPLPAFVRFSSRERYAEEDNSCANPPPHYEDPQRPASIVCVLPYIASQFILILESHRAPTHPTPLSYAPVTFPGSTTSYNETTGILKIENRGGYGDDEDADLLLHGPGTLYTTHLDLEAEVDYLTITDDDGDVVKLTGNYSACINQASYEETYMDLNLAPGTHTYSSDHDTEETQNVQVRGGILICCMMVSSPTSA